MSTVHVIITSYNSWTFQKTVKWLDSSPPRFGKEVILILLQMLFFMKELKGAILSQNHWRSQVGGPESPGPVNRNATIDKNLTKKFFFFIFGFFWHVCVQQYMRTAVMNNKLYWWPGGPAHPLNSIFSNQFKRITKVKSRVLVLKVATLAPHLKFLWT